MTRNRVEWPREPSLYIIKNSSVNVCGDWATVALHHQSPAISRPVCRWGHVTSCGSGSFCLFSRKCCFFTTPPTWISQAGVETLETPKHPFPLLSEVAARCSFSTSIKQGPCVVLSPQKKKKKKIWGEKTNTWKGFLEIYWARDQQWKKVFGERKTSPGGAAQSCILARVNSCESRTAQHNQGPEDARGDSAFPLTHPAAVSAPDCRTQRGSVAISCFLLTCNKKERLGRRRLCPFSSPVNFWADVNDARLDVVVDYQLRLKPATSAEKWLSGKRKKKAAKEVPRLGLLAVGAEWRRRCQVQVTAHTFFC